MRIALAGNPNSGKSTIFNALTGGHAHVGNWPGVTVEKKEGKFRHNGREVIVIDLPGTYSLTPFSLDERIARHFVLREKPDAVVCVVDSANLPRNLYLVVSLLETGRKVILDLNMADLAENQGLKVDSECLKKALGIPVVRTIGTKGKGIPELKEAILQVGEENGAEFRLDYGKDIEEAISRLVKRMEGTELPYPPRFIAIKLLEEDQEIIEELKAMNQGDVVEFAMQESLRLEKEFGYEVKTELVERRYGFIEGLIRSCVKRTSTTAQKLLLSDRIDRIVLNRIIGIPLFLFSMWLTFELTFKVGGFFSDYIDAFFGWLGEASGKYLQALGSPPWLCSLVSDGLINGIGTVLTFLPNIMVLFLFLSFLEDTGYMARAAFLMDKTMLAMGLPGRAFLPLLLGFGCNVPAIMSTRTVPNAKDRLLSILINPFMSCSARLPIYVMFISVFFKEHQGIVLFSLYLLGITVAVLSAKLFRLKIPFFKGPISPLVMELPPYRLPTLKGVLIHMWERSSQFLKKAGTIIFAGVLTIWLLAHLPPGVEYASQSTYAGKIGKLIAPLLRPAGFPFWQAGVALLFGIIAKETVVGTFGTLFGGEENLSTILPQYFNPVSAYAFMVMSLLYIPCIASIGAIYRETGSFRWTVFAVLYSLFIGWLSAVIVYQFGKILVLNI